MTRGKDVGGVVSPYITPAGSNLWRIAYWITTPTGERIRRFKKGYRSEQDARSALEEIRVDIRRGDHVEPVRQTLNDYAQTYFAALRVSDTTMAGYRKHYRVHVQPSPVGQSALSDITADRLNAFYRGLERGGRKDRGHVGEPLGAATVRHVHVLISQILAHAVDAGVLRFNPAKRASPPTKRDAAPPEMTTWSIEETAQFLEWSRTRGDYFWTAWFVLLSTGMRRGELLALRWRDIDFANRVITVARSMSYVKEAGTPPVISFKRPKSGRVRNIDIDAGLADVLRDRKTAIVAVAPELARADSLVFTNRYGNPHNPVQFSRQWRERNAQAVAEIPELPTLHLHELRHTHATLLLRAGVHPKIVSERLGHADVQMTMNVYSHAVRTLQRGAADLIGTLLSGEGVPRSVPRPL